MRGRTRDDVTRTDSGYSADTVKESSRVLQTINSNNAIENNSIEAKVSRKEVNVKGKTLRKLFNFFNSEPPRTNILEDMKAFTQKQPKPKKKPRTWRSDSEENTPTERKTDKNSFVDHAYDYDQLYASIPRVTKTILNRRPKLTAPWGQVSLKAESEWMSCPIALRELYAKKTFIDSGLYFDQGLTEKKEFQFQLPSGHGQDILNNQAEFELSYDIILFYETSGGADKMKQLLTGPTKFVRLRKNIFVDRKPRKNLICTACHCGDENEEEDNWQLDERRMNYIKVKKVIGCGENCINRCMFYECDETCLLKEKCTNRTFQLKEDLAALQICHSSGRGFGLKTPTFIPSGKLVCEYRGEIISQETCEERMETLYKDLENYYFLEYAHGEVLDGCRKGTEARFVNHSCDPNCHIEKWYVDGEYHIGVFSSEDIEPGAEITYDYRFKSFGPLQRCNCGSENCGGYIGINKKDPLYEGGKSIKKSIPKRGINQSENGTESKKEVFKIKTLVMDPTQIVYSSTAQMKLLFKNTLMRLGNIQEDIRDMNLFLPRNMRHFVKLEILILGIKMPEEYTHLTRLCPTRVARRSRSLTDILGYLGDVLHEKETRKLGVESDYESEAFTDIEIGESDEDDACGGEGHVDEEEDAVLEMKSKKMKRRFLNRSVTFDDEE